MKDPVLPRGLSLKFRPEAKAVLERYRRFFAPGSGPAVMAIVAIGRHQLVPEPELGEKPRPSLNAYRFPDDNRRYLGDLVAYWESKFELRQGVDDDYLPAVFPYYGSAFDSAFLAGEVEYAADTSWSRPMLGDARSGLSLSVDPPNVHYRQLIDGVRLVSELSAGRFFPAPALASGPADIAFALRGEALLLDLDDSPEDSAELLQVCAKAFIQCQQTQLDITGEVLGGSILGWGMWMPGRAVFFGEDMSNMVSEKWYRTRLLACAQQVVDAFDSTCAHIHSASLHMAGAVLELEGLTALEISRDPLPGTPAPLDHAEPLLDRAGDTALILECSPEEIVRNIGSLRRGRVILNTGAASVEEANELLRFIRSSTPRV